MNSHHAYEIDLIQLFLILWKRKSIILGFSLCITLMAVFHQAFIAEDVYRSDAVLIPTSSSSSAPVLAQLGGLASFVGVEMPKSENTLVLILNSRSFIHSLVEDFRLTERWGMSHQDAASMVKDEVFSVEVSKKTPLITVAWEDEDPKLAKQLIEAVVDKAHQWMEEHAKKKSNLKVVFLEGRVADALKSLSQAEEELKAFQEEHEGVNIEKQAEALIYQIQELRVEQHGKEVELEVARNFFNSQASEVRILDNTVEELKKKIDELVGDARDTVDSTESLGERSLMEIPKVGLLYVRKMRNVKLNQKIYGVLLEQLELARIESQKEVESFELMDPPLVPEKRVRPKPILTVVIAFLASGLVAVTTILMFHFFRSLREERGPRS